MICKVTAKYGDGLSYTTRGHPHKRAGVNDLTRSASSSPRRPRFLAYLVGDLLAYQRRAPRRHRHGRRRRGYGDNPRPDRISGQASADTGRVNTPRHHPSPTRTPPRSPPAQRPGQRCGLCLNCGTRSPCTLTRRASTTWHRPSPTTSGIDPYIVTKCRTDGLDNTACASSPGLPDAQPAVRRTPAGIAPTAPAHGAHRYGRPPTRTHRPSS